MDHSTPIFYMFYKRTLSGLFDSIQKVKKQLRKSIPKLLSAIIIYVLYAINHCQIWIRP